MQTATYINTPRANPPGTVGLISDSINLKVPATVAGAGALRPAEFVIIHEYNFISGLNLFKWGVYRFLLVVIGKFVQEEITTDHVKTPMSQIIESGTVSMSHTDP